MIDETYEDAMVINPTLVGPRFPEEHIEVSAGVRRGAKQWNKWLANLPRKNTSQFKLIF